ncbi:interleukin-1 receptor type 1-like [Festucalex cinctus]
MDFLRLILMVTVTLQYSAASELPCKDFDREKHFLLEGESFHFVPYIVTDSEVALERFTWFRQSSGDDLVVIPSNESERIHHHGGALFLLNVTAEDGGFYTARQNLSDNACENSYVEIQVLEASYLDDKRHFYGTWAVSTKRRRLVVCPDPVAKICRRLNGTFSWYKNDTLLIGQQKVSMWLHNIMAEDEGVYTCVCTWTHAGYSYTSSGSWEIVTGSESIVSVKLCLLGLHLKTGAEPISSDLLILSPKEEEEIHTDEGVELRLNCSVYCGINMDDSCSAQWKVDGKDVERDGYTQNKSVHTSQPSQKTFATAILTIAKVSSRDFRKDFKCIGSNGFCPAAWRSLSLQHRGTLTAVWRTAVCVVLLCVSAGLLIKVFMVDITLLLRPYLPLAACDEATKRYDALVLLETPAAGQHQEGEQFSERPPEGAVGHMLAFMEQLVSVLEEACRFRLFVPHRDNLPGGDHIEQIQQTIEQSRRLILVLAPRPESSNQELDSSPHFVTPHDWQVALHHVLTQPKMAVIVIQVGQAGTGKYAHLPPSLRHLLAKSAPLRWSLESHGAATRHSRFWKNVRYLMPATPAGSIDDGFAHKRETKTTTANVEAF